MIAMAEKCRKHGKDSTARCLWCHAPLCSLCIENQEGKKHYCSKCFKQLAEHVTHKNARKEYLKKHL